MEKMNGSVYNHSIFRINDNKELCRIRIEWKRLTINKLIILGMKNSITIRTSV